MSKAVIQRQTVFPQVVANHSHFSLDGDWDAAIFLTQTEINLLSFGFCRKQLKVLNINVNPDGFATHLCKYIPFDNHRSFNIKSRLRCKADFSLLFIDYDCKKYMRNNYNNSTFCTEFEYTNNSCFIQKNSFEFQFGLVGIGNDHINDSNSNHNNTTTTNNNNNDTNDNDKTISSASLHNVFFNGIDKQLVQFTSNEYPKKKTKGKRALHQTSVRYREISQLILNNREIKKLLSIPLHQRIDNLPVYYIKLQGLRDGLINVEHSTYGDGWTRHLDEQLSQQLTKIGFKFGDFIRLTVDYGNKTAKFELIKRNSKEPIQIGHSIKLDKDYYYFPAMAAVGCQCEDECVAIKIKIVEK